MTAKASSTDELSTTMTKNRTTGKSYSEAIGVVQLQGSVNLMKFFLSNAQYAMIMVDAAIDQGQVSAGNCYARESIKMKFTAEMLEAIKDSYKSIDSKMPPSELKEKSALVGTEIKNPSAISYTVLNPNSGRTFNKRLSIGSSSAICTNNDVSDIDEVLLWTDDGKKFSILLIKGSLRRHYLGLLVMMETQKRVLLTCMSKKDLIKELLLLERTPNAIAE